MVVEVVLLLVQVLQEVVEVLVDQVDLEELIPLVLQQNGCSSNRSFYKYVSWSC